MTEQTITLTLPVSAVSTISGALAHLGNATAIAQAVLNQQLQAHAEAQQAAIQQAPAQGLVTPGQD